MYLYQKNSEYFAQIANELIPDGKKELAWLGAEKIKEEYRGLKFQANKETLYNINYKSRLSTRILAPVVAFKCDNQNKLYNTGYSINWADFLSADKTFAVFANVSDSAIDNSHFASLKLKDAIVDNFRDKTGIRPDVDTKNPDLWINLYIRHDYAVISIDTSGGSLHKRGYKKKSVEAPIQETLAAEIIQLTDWDTEQPLYDPMCGSGTLLCEALMYCSNIPAGYLRKNFGFNYLPDFDISIWEKIQEKGEKRIMLPEEGVIAGSDISQISVNATLANVNNLPGGNNIQIKKSSFQNLKEIGNSMIVSNPPYGIRLQRGEDMSGFYKEFGDFLKTKCKGSTAFIYFGDRAYIKKIGLKASWKKPLKNGGLDGRLAKYEMY